MFSALILAILLVVGLIIIVVIKRKIKKWIRYEIKHTLRFIIKFQFQPKRTFNALVNGTKVSNQNLDTPLTVAIELELLFYEVAIVVEFLKIGLINEINLNINVVDSKMLGHILLSDIIPYFGLIIVIIVPLCIIWSCFCIKKDSK